MTFAAGAVDRPILPRSSNKPVQATALLAAGWSPRSAQELAIGAGSHNGEDGHRGVAAAESDLSERRRGVQQVMDGLAAELGRRYRDGEADVAALLADEGR